MLCYLCMCGHMCGNCLCVGIGYVWVLAMNVYRRVRSSLVVWWELEMGQFGEGVLPPTSRTQQNDNNKPDREDNANK